MISTFPVRSPFPKESSLYAIRSGENSELGIADAATTVIVRVKGQNHILSVFQIFAHVFDLTCVYARHGELDGTRKVDDGFAVCSRFPHIKNSITYLEGVLGLCAGKALRAVLEAVILSRLLGQLLEEALRLRRRSV